MPKLFNAIKNSTEKASARPSGRGQTAGGAGSHRIDQPYRQIGMPPRDTMGSPSMSADVNASEIMQNKIMNDDDREWYEELNTIMAKNFLKPRFTVTNGSDVGLHAGKSIAGERMNESLREFINLVLEKKELMTEPDDLDKKKKKKKKKDKNEISSVAGGSISGYTGPLSAGPKKQRKKNAKVNARAFAGGKIVGKFY